MKTVCDHLLDMKGAVSPLTLLRVIQVFREMKVNETLELLGSDPETRTNLLKVLPSSSYHVISEEELNGDTPCFRIRIRKELGETTCGTKHSMSDHRGRAGCQSEQEEPRSCRNVTLSSSSVEKPLEDVSEQAVRAGLDDGINQGNCPAKDTPHER